MAKQTIQHSQHVSNMIKIGKPRSSKQFRVKGNAAAKTSKKGNGKRLR